MMIVAALVSLSSPGAFAAAAVVAAVAVAAAGVRRPALPAPALGLATIGTVLLALAAGGPVWHKPADAAVVVMVDLSPSTRTARYRDAEALRARLNELVPAGAYRLVSFGGPGAAEELNPSALPASLADLRAEETAFAPPAAAAVVVFSDARFQPPAAAPPTFVVVDPSLEAPADAAVERLEAGDAGVSVTTRNGGGPRELAVTGAESSPPRTVPRGPLVSTWRIAAAVPTATRVVARLSAGDAWPENDSLALSARAPQRGQAWWVGGAPPAGGGWQSMAPSDLPADPAAFLAPQVVVLDNVSAIELSAAHLSRLVQYVRDLGGGLVILGGDRAFAAGGYTGTQLETLSPLASTPSLLMNRWVLLIDSSGSMNASGGPGGASRWRTAVDAAATVLRALPPDDVAAVGGFAAQITWWVSARRAGDAAVQQIPPPGASPSGPTELRRAIDDVAASADPAPPTQLVLFTDGNADLGDAATLSAALRSKNIRLHFLAIGDERAAAPGLAALRQIVSNTGGTLVAEADPTHWVDAARRLLRAASPTFLQSTQARLSFIGDLAGLPAREVTPWNRTWAKPAATVLGELTPRDGSRAPAAARWQVGEGAVAAVAFSGATAEETAGLVRTVARPPRDPRLRVTWRAGAKLHVLVDATDGDAPLDGLNLTLRLDDPSAPSSAASSRAIPQTAAGRYELSIDAPRYPAIASVRRGGGQGSGVVDRMAVAGRYPPEFEAIGNDRGAMRALAERTGGRVVEPTDARPLDLPRPSRDVSLASPLAAAGAACVALALVLWKRSR